MTSEPGRAILSIVYDDLMGDACLIPLLETEDQVVVHGSDDPCDQPETRHLGQPVRRYDRGLPGHFVKAVVAFGALTKSTHATGTPRWVEDWVFRVSAYAQKTVATSTGSTSGDLHVQDIVDHVIRILAWDQKRSECSSPVKILNRQLDGFVRGPEFDTVQGWFVATVQFRWTVIARGLVAPAPACCP